VQVGIGLLGGALWILACVLYVERTGLALPGLTGLVVLPFLVGVHLAVAAQVARSNLTPQLAVSALVLVWLIPVFVVGWLSYAHGTPEKMFERLIARPMPESVRNFRWGGGVGIDGSYIVVFEAAPQDVKELVERLKLQLQTPEQAEDFSRCLMRQCASWKVPFVPFSQPLCYSQTNESSAGWHRQLLTDAEHQHAYVVVH
jgi:hypothetical protein